MLFLCFMALVSICKLPFFARFHAFELLLLNPFGKLLNFFAAIILCTSNPTPGVAAIEIEKGKCIMA